MLIIEQSSGFDGSVKLVYMADEDKQKAINVLIPRAGKCENIKLLSAKDGRDVDGLLAFCAVDG